MLRRGRAEQTADLYIRNIKGCLKDRRGHLARVSTEGLAPKTRRTYKAALAAWADFTEDEMLRRRLRDIKLPPPDRIKEKRALTERDWRAVIMAVADRDEDEPLVGAIGLVCHRGFRIGDVGRIRRVDVKSGLSSGVLNYLSKGNRRTRWSITDQMAVYLEAFMRRNKWTHVWDLTAPKSRADLRWRGARLNAQREFKKIVKASGIDGDGVSLHILRRTYAWHYLRHAQLSGGGPVELQKHMGWASINTAMQYVDQSDREKQDAVAAGMAMSILGD